MVNIEKVICITTTLVVDGEEPITYDQVEVGKIYDMKRILDTDENSWDMWNCYIYDRGLTWRLPLHFFEPLDEYRNKKINNILN